MEFNKKVAQDRFNLCIDSLKKAVGSLSVRASSSFFDPVRCEVYGSHHPIANFCNITVADSKTMSIQIWDASAVQPIYKAIQASGLGVNPILEGQTIRVVLPPISEERRKSMCHVVKNAAEQARISVRNVRRDIIEEIKKTEKDKLISEDVRKRQEADVQKLTDDAIKAVDVLADGKTAEIMKV